MKIAKTSICAFAVVLVSGQQARAQASVMTSLNPTGKQMGQIPAGPPAKRIKGCENAPAGTKNIQCWYMVLDEKTGKYNREDGDIASYSVNGMVLKEYSQIIDNDITSAVNEAITSSYLSTPNVFPSADARTIRDKAIDFRATAMDIVKEARSLDAAASYDEIQTVVNTQDLLNSREARSNADRATGVSNTSKEEGARGVSAVSPQNTLKTCPTYWSGYTGPRTC